MVKYKYVEFSFYKESLLINVKGIQTCLVCIFEFIGHRPIWPIPVDKHFASRNCMPEVPSGILVMSVSIFEGTVM